MSLFILALIVAAIVCGIAWRRPDARAAVSGAWQAGKAQAVQEFRDGYTFAQQRLRAGNPRWYNPRRWASWGLSTGYGTVKTLAAANRIRRAAWRGARDQYRAWKAAQPVDGEVIEAVVVKPAPDQQQPGASQPDKPSTEPQQEAAPDPQPTAETPPATDPGQAPEPNQEGTPVQTEATGLTSYAHAHQQFAAELQAQMSGSESLAASMKDVLAEHSDLIGDTAVLQDLLNQAAGVAQRIADRAITVANN